MKIVPIGSRHSDDIIRRFVASELRIPETDDEGFDKSAAKCEKDCPPGCDCECVCHGKEASSKAETAKEATACPNCGAHMQKTGNMERCSCGYGQATQAARTAKAAKDTGVAEYYKKIYPDDYAKEMTSDGCVTPEAGKKVEYGHKPALKVSVRSLLGYTNDVNIPDKNPESGVSSGSGKTETPDPKWQSGDSANSVSGPERVESHGTGSSPKEQGKVDVPDLGVPGKQKAKNARMIVRAGEEAGKVNVKDPKPQEGVGAGSAATETPDPKWQASPSANSVSGLEVVESHGAGSSPEEAGQVEAPNLQANRMISRETIAKFCPECAQEMTRRGIKAVRAGFIAEQLAKNAEARGFLQRRSKAPEGWESTVKKMKKHKEIDNPWALAHWMDNKGYESHK